MQWTPVPSAIVFPHIPKRRFHLINMPNTKAAEIEKKKKKQKTNETKRCIQNCG